MAHWLEQGSDCVHVFLWEEGHLGAVAVMLIVGSAVCICCSLSCLSRLLLLFLLIVLLFLWVMLLLMLL